MNRIIRTLTRCFLSVSTLVAATAGLTTEAGCKPTSSTAPALSSYRADLRARTVLVPEPPDGPFSGRITVADGDGMVLTLDATKGGSILTRDTESTYTLAFELPKGALDTDKSSFDLAKIRSVARIASEDVVYFSTKAEGTLTLAKRDGDKVEATLDARFSAPVRDYVKLDRFTLSGVLTATVTR